jgi:hypothetical protein
MTEAVAPLCSVAYKDEYEVARLHEHGVSIGVNAMLNDFTLNYHRTTAAVQNERARRVAKARWPVDEPHSGQRL